MPNWLEENLRNTFKLPNDAVTWLLMLFNVSQVFDDFADGAEVDRSDLNKAIWDSLVGMPTNPFFLNNANWLLPVVATAIHKWVASDTAERNGSSDEKSFVWRAGYYDIVLMVVQLCHGPEKAMEVAHKVMELYGEKFEEYLEEFPHV